MNRNLKALVAAALSLSALGVVGPSSAEAFNDEFRCSVNPCRLTAKQDGIGATSHQVLIVENATKSESVSFTCHEISGDAEFGSSATSITATGIEYKTCTVNGSPGVTIDMNGCRYTFTRGSGLSTIAGTTDGADMHLECLTGKKIQVTIPALECTFEIGPQSLNGVGYQTLGSAPFREITLTAKNVGGIVVTRNAGCASLIQAELLTGTYTTGNVILRAETTGGFPAEAWFG